MDNCLVPPQSHFVLLIWATEEADPVDSGIMTKLKRNKNILLRQANIIKIYTIDRFVCRHLPYIYVIPQVIIAHFIF